MVLIDLYCYEQLSKGTKGDPPFFCIKIGYYKRKAQYFCANCLVDGPKNHYKEHYAASLVELQLHKCQSCETPLYFIQDVLHCQDCLMEISRQEYNRFPTDFELAELAVENSRKVHTILNKKFAVGGKTLTLRCLELFRDQWYHQ